MDLCTTLIVFCILTYWQPTRGASSSISPSGGNVLEGRGVILSCTFPKGMYTNLFWSIVHNSSGVGVLLEGNRSYDVNEYLYFTDDSERGMYAVSYSDSGAYEFSQLFITNVTAADGMYQFACVDITDQQETVIGSWLQFDVWTRPKCDISSPFPTAVLRGDMKHQTWVICHVPANPLTYW